MNTNCGSLILNADAISVKGLDLSIGPKILLSSADFTITPGDRIALLGRNGCGKSTLFHWISTLTKQWSIYEVAQELEPTQQSITSVVLSAHLERGRLWARQAELEEKEDLTDEELEEYTQIGDTLSSMKADSDPPLVKRILHGLGFSQEEMDKPLSTFSGGWRSRVALAQGLFMRPKLLLLDEPTNHLDLNGVLWLSEYLKSWPTSLIVISHNAGFVRSISTSIWSIQRGSLIVYRTNYDRYLRLRQEEEKKAQKAWETLEKEVTVLKKKGTPASRKAAEDLLEKRAKEGVVRPEKAYAPKFFFIESDTSLARVGPLLTTENATLGYDSVVLGNVSFSLFQDSRIALVGANGSGKSTLLKFLHGELEALDGFVSRRAGLRVCKFDQHFYHSMPEDKTPLEYLSSLAVVSEDGTKVEVDTLRKILGASGLEGSAHTRPIHTLSGGQKARVYFGSISVQAPDILLMDEPTNHLDMETIEGLISGLQDFPGAILIVSHDVDFLEEVSTEVWETKEGTLQKRKDLDEYIDSILDEFTDE